MSHIPNTRQPTSRSYAHTQLLTKLNRYSFKLLGERLPGLMSWWALRLWSGTHRFPASAREQRMQLRASECSLWVNGKQVKAWQWGNGPTVLLVHGWNGRGLQLSPLIEPLLIAGYQVISFDAPGHGQTEGNKTHLTEIRDVILALSERHGPLHAAIGHSFGVACLAAAVNAGLNIPNLIGISSPGGLSKLIERYCQAMSITPATEDALRQRLSERLGASLWQQFAESYPINHGVERSLVIHDRLDQVVPWQESEHLALCWPNAELLLTEGLGHRRILTDQALAKKITAFINNASF